MFKRYYNKKIRSDYCEYGFSLRCFNSEYDAASAWSEKYRSLGIRREYAAFVYAVDIDGEVKYYTGHTYAGMGRHGIIRPNVVIPFLYLYLIQSAIERLKYKAGIAAFLHTHPKPPTGYTYKRHSAEDLFLLKLPGINAVYVIAFENNELSRAHK